MSSTSSSSAVSSSSSAASSSSSSSGSSPSPSRPRAEDAGDELHPVQDDEEEYAPSPTLLAAYDALMASHLPEISLPLSNAASAHTSVLAPPPDDEEEPEDPDRPLTKAERQNAKKKRRRERERALKAAAAAAKGEVLPSQAAKKAEEGPVPFRLFAPLAPVSLSTVEEYELTRNPRLRALPADVQARIRRLAAEAAVDPPLFPSPNPSLLPDEEVWRADKAPPAFLAYTAKVEHKCVAVPAVQLRRCEGADTMTEREKEREELREERRTKRRRAFPPAQYWTPPAGVVARGYGYGWSL